MAKNKQINKPISDESEATLEKVVGSSQDSINTEGTPTAIKDQSVDTSIKDATTPKSVFNTKKAAELVGVGDTNIGNSVAALGAARSVAFSGGAGNIQGDMSATTRSEAPRKSGNRPGRTLDTALKHIDDVIAETYTVPLNTIPNIRDGSSAVGYNGNYSNKHAVSQKGSGGSPASRKFFRTLDLVQYDNMYYAEGQYIYGNELLIHSWNATSNSYPSTDEHVYTLGDYLHRNLRVSISTEGEFESLSFDVDNLTNDEADISEDVIRLAGDNRLRQNNIAELDRINMVNVAGDESKDNWSPLARVIRDPSDANRYMKELDAIAGDFAYLSISKLKTALSYQLNKAAKDGSKKISPMYEMCLGNVEGNELRHGSSAQDEDAAPLFRLNLDTGNAALFIALQDTTTKYNTKGKLLSLPLSFKTALDTAQKNCGSLMAHDTFIKEYNRQEVFGKIDEDGSGMTPYFISDGAALITPLNLGEINGSVHDRVPDIVLHWEDLRNKYDSHVYDFFTQGLVNWFKRKSHKIATLLASAGVTPVEGFYELTIPVTSTTCCLSLWDIIVCDAMKDIAVERQYAMEQVIKYEQLNHSYPYSGLVKLDSVNIGGTNNVGFTDINTPLSTKPIPLTTGARILMPEVFSPKTVLTTDASLIGGNCQTSQVILPWYFNQGGFEPTDIYKSGSTTKVGTTWTLKCGDSSHMTTFVTRGGVSFGNMDRILSMDPEQLRLCMDRMIDIPGQHACCKVDLNYKDSEGVSHFGHNSKSYKYDMGDDGMLIYEYNAYAIDENKLEDILSIGDILKTPRELGLSFIAPAGIVTPAYTNGGSNYRKISSSYLGTSGPSFRLIYWASSNIISDTLFEDHLGRAVEFNLTANYHAIEATSYRGDDRIGIYVSANRGNMGSSGLQTTISPVTIVQGDAAYNYGTATYNDGEIVDNTIYNIDLVSNIKYFYTRVQLLPFIINPFDSNAYVYTTTKIDANRPINIYDDFDFLHLYNVCGFMDGEYSGTEFDRNRARVENGLAYVQDPYIDRRL